MAAGIYVIRNSLNGDEYLGQTGNFVKRWKDHQKDLNNGRHSNRHLKFAWQFYGESAFVFEIIEVVPDLRLLDDREIALGTERKPAYNLAPFGQAQRNTNGKLYSDELAARVKYAFDQLCQSNDVIMPGDIAKLALCGSTSVWRVLKDVEWWTKEHQQAAQAERWRRALATQEKNGWTAGRQNLQRAREKYAELHPIRSTRQYSVARAEHVIQSFIAYRSVHEFVVLSDFAREIGIVRQTIRPILQDAGLWTREDTRSAMFHAGKRTYQNRSDAALSDLRKGNETMRSQGYPNLKKALQVSASQNYRGVRLAAQRSAELGHPGGVIIQQRASKRAEELHQWLTQWFTSHDRRPKIKEIANSMGITETNAATRLKRLRRQHLIDDCCHPI
jgi:group I intron endonuclease